MKSWDEIIAMITKIFAVLLYYKAILHDITSFDPYNLGDFVSPCCREGNCGLNGLNNVPKIK